MAPAAYVVEAVRPQRDKVCNPSVVNIKRDEGMGGWQNILIEAARECF